MSSSIDITAFVLVFPPKDDTEKIDDAVAAIMALDRAVRNGGSTGMCMMRGGF